MRACVYVVRHGETEENKLGIIQGQMNTHMNYSGHAQAVQLALALRVVKFDIGFSSDLARAVETAEVILSSHPQAKLFVQEALRERSMGELEGHVRPPRKRLPQSVESDEAIRARALKWWRDSLMQHVSSLPAGCPTCHILVVSHGAFIGVLIRSLIRSGELARADSVVVGRCVNTAVSIVEIQQNAPAILMKYGDVSHLTQTTIETNADEE